MVFSAPNLVFVGCVAFSLLFRIFCSYINFIQVVVLPFLGPFFHGMLLLQSMCAAHYFGLVFNLYFSFILWRPRLFCKHALSNIL